VGTRSKTATLTDWRASLRASRPPSSSARAATPNEIPTQTDHTVGGDLTRFGPNEPK
jgi:hypothetical protein